MIRIYNHPALECYSSFYGLEKFIGVPQVSFAFQTVYSSDLSLNTVSSLCTYIWGTFMCLYIVIRDLSPSPRAFLQWPFPVHRELYITLYILYVKSTRKIYVFSWSFMSLSFKSMLWKQAQQEVRFETKSLTKAKERATGTDGCRQRVSVSVQ